MELFTWTLPLWKMQISEQEYVKLKYLLRLAFLTNNSSKLRPLAKEAALFCAEWWRREHIEGHPSRSQVVKDLGLDESYKKKFFDLANYGLKQLKINPVKITNEHKFRTLLLQGGLPIAMIKNSGDAINGYQRFLTGLIRYAKNININWADHSFIKSLNCLSYLPKTFRNEGIYELSLLIANAIITDNDELLPYDVTEEYWKEFTNSLKQSAQSFSYKVPFIINWKAKKNNGNVELFYGLECAKKISESFVAENQLDGCYSFSIYINNKFAASYTLTNENIFIIRDSINVFEKWHGEPVVNFHIKTEDNRIIELTTPNCTPPDFESPFLIAQVDEKDKIWEIKNSTRGNFKNATVFQESWVLKNTNVTCEDIILGNLTLKWFEFSNSIELENADTGELCFFDENESAYKHEFINWKTNWILQSNYKVLTNEPIIRVYDENQDKVASNKFTVFFRVYKTSNWEKIGANGLPIGLLEFKIVYPDGKYGKERFFHTGPLGIEYKNMNLKKGAIQWNWNLGKAYSISNQVGLKINKKEAFEWEIERDNDNQTYYPEKVGFILEPTANSPGLEVYVAAPFYGIIIIDKNGDEVPTNRIISSNALYSYRYVVMGYEKIKTEVFHLENQKVVIKGELRQGINSLSRFDDDIRKLFDFRGSETFSEESKVRIIIGSGNNVKTIEVRDFNLYTKYAGSIDGIQVINNRNEMQLVDYDGIIQAVSVNCSTEEIQVVELEKTEEGFVFNPEYKLAKFIVFADKYNNNGCADLIVPRYFDFAFQADETNVENPSGLSPQESNILTIKKKLDNTTAMDDEWKKVHKYFIIAINHHIPFKTFNHLRATARTPELLAKLAISLSQSAEMAKALPREKMINALVSFERELAFGWHWLNADRHWIPAIDWYLQRLPDFLQNDILGKALGLIKELLDHSLFNQNKELINRLLNDDCKPNVAPPSNAEVYEIRAKLGANQNYPQNLVFIPNEWASLFPNALNNGIPLFVRSFLFSPVKAALAFMGKDLSIWLEENLEIRRVINFYRQLKPNEYLSVFENMVCQIKNKYI